MKEYKSEKYIKEGLSLGIFITLSPLACSEHTHEFVEIVYVLSGEGVETINGTDHTTHRGDLLFINKGAVHKVTPVSNYSYINVCFSPDIMGERVITRENAFDLLSLTAIDEFRREYGAEIISFYGEERHRLEALLYDMVDEFKSDMSERAAVLESYMTILVAKILRVWKSPTKNNGKSAVFREISAYIDENLDKKLSLDDLAKKCFYNPSYFSRVFKEKFGTTLAEYIMRERAEAAAKLLHTGEISMDGIAERCGFGDRTGLYRAFVKFYGISPAEYRKKTQKK